MRKPTRVILLVAFVFTLLTACSDNEAKKVRLYQDTAAPIPEASTPAPLRVAVAAMISPKETFFQYRRLLDLAGEELGRPIKLVQRHTYEEVNDLLREGRLDLAFICSGAYVTASRSFGLEILAVPQVNGRTVYFSYFIVPKGSPYKDLSDLEGKKFAFTDPLSNTGKLSPTFTLAQMGLAPETFFAKTIYTYSHDNSIAAVAEGQVDGAAVDSLVWDYLNRTRPELISRTRIIKVSEPYGIPPLVTGTATPPETRKKLQRFLFHLHENAQGRKVLQKIMVDRFVPGNDKMYDSIRRISRWTENRTGKNQ